MRTIEEIDREIDQLKRELAEVKGRETEVYSRIVGYYRSVKNWNKGKKQEFSERVLYNPTFERIEEQIARASLSPADDRSVSCSQEEEEVHSSLKHPSSYLFFFRPTCPNCPPVKRVLAGLPLEGRMINVDTEHGITEARSKDVLSAPTVIFFDAEGHELFRSGDADAIAQYAGSCEAVRA